jgi:hypothetical protein
MPPRFRFLSTCIVLGLVCIPASAQQLQPAIFPNRQCNPPQLAPGPNCPQPCPFPIPVPEEPDKKAKEPEKEPGKEPTIPPDAAPQTDAFAQTPPAGTPGGGGFNPAMFGDLAGATMQKTITTIQPATPTAKVVKTNVFVPLLCRGSFKVAENESPKPCDRIFVNYNFFSDVNLGEPSIGNASLHRETFGFEKTFLDGDASFELRVPVIQFTGGGISDASGFGDISFLFKYACINDRETGNVLAFGLMFTAPTDTGSVDNVCDQFHDWLIQPFLGYLVNIDKCFIHGFESLVVPTDSRDATILFTDIGVGYWVYRARNGVGGLLTGVAPTMEMHVVTPFNHRGLNNGTEIGVPDWVTLTGGAHVFFGPVEVGCAVGTPITGPKPFDLEVLAHINIHF